MKKFYAIPWIICFLFIQNITIHSQTSITGKITDKETGEDMISANIVVWKNGVFIQGKTTDIDGNYSIGVDEGSYDLEISYTGYATKKISAILVTGGYANVVDVKLSAGGYDTWGGGCLLWGWVIPLIRQDENPNKLKITSEQIRNLPTRNINQISSMTPGVSFSQ